MEIKQIDLTLSPKLIAYIEFIKYWQNECYVYCTLNVGIPQEKHGEIQKNIR